MSKKPRKPVQRGTASKRTKKPAETAKPSMDERLAALPNADAETLAMTDRAITGAESSDGAQKVLDAPPPVAVSSPSSERNDSNKEKIMDVTLTRGKVSKSGKKAQYRSVALVRAVVLPLALFAAGVFPETVTLSGTEFATVGADEQAKAEKRNADRVAKGLKPKATPAELLQKETARTAKLQAKLDKANARAQKLAAKVGNAPAAAEPVAEPVSQ